MGKFPLNNFIINDICRFGRVISCGAGAGLLLTAGCSTDAGDDPPKPNIILILADDMGYSDIGCFGGEIPTPNIDRLAENGIRFTRFYNGGRCCPTRASLLTGLYAHQAGVGAMIEPGDRPGYLGRLNDSCATLAELLRKAGYQTFMSGKWHVTHYDYNDPEPTLHRGSWPLQRGFERFFGTLAGAGSFFTPVSLMTDNEFTDPDIDFYYTDAISDHAVRFIGEAAGDRPFFLYVSHVAPHWPLHALPEHIEMFTGTYDKGWDKLREERYERMARMGLIDGNWPLSPRDEQVPAWEDAPDKEWESHRMAVYAAQVYSMDLGVGRIIEALESRGILKNTLIVFLSDNGSSSEVIQGTDTRHGYFAQGGTTPGVFPGPPDTYASYGRPWANAGNTPYRRYKRWMHEGGIATPMVAHWPAVIRGGRISHHVGHIIDFMPTFLEAAGGTYPDTFNGNMLTPLEGISLYPVFRGNEQRQEQHTALFWEHIGYKAVRQGNWKLVSGGESWELYDLESDRTELHDLTPEFPERVEEMIRMWEEWAVRVNVK
jgi:arylsulfatase A-like enzyme